MVNGTGSEETEQGEEGRACGRMVGEEDALDTVVDAGSTRA
jgi:hypothetical protein